MATCRECLHYDACLMMFKAIYNEDPFLEGKYSEHKCHNFKLKSDYVKRERGGWISVKDRLPKQDKLVLCYNVQRPKREPFIGRYLGGSYSEAMYAFLSVHRGCSVGATHWQPLPEPPKGK